MAAANSSPRVRVPKVRIARPEGRGVQLRYRDPESGKEVRVSIGDLSESEAESRRDKLAAELLLGIETRNKQQAFGPRMSWEAFRDQYSLLRVSNLRPKAGISAEQRLDVCEKTLRPKTLAEAAEPSWLALLQSRLLASGKGRRRRSSYTVRSYMRAFMASLNWAHKMQWLPAKVHCELLRVDQVQKGRPLTTAEFLAMLEAVPLVCRHGAEAWTFLLRGLWESGLRLGEALDLSWDDPKAIRPVRLAGGHVALSIPGERQKNRKAQVIPATPAFAALLASIPEDRRTGWVFPVVNRRGGQRPCTAKASKIIIIMAKAAGVFVEGTQPAGAHDLRRSFGQRMADSGVNVRDLQSLMRHASVTTTETYYLRHNVAEQAERLAKTLGVYPEKVGTVEDSGTATKRGVEAANPV